MRTEPRSYGIKVSNGTNLHVLEWGVRSQGPTCVLIHGLAEGSFVWNIFAESIAASCHIIAVDLKGHGRSDWSPTGDYKFYEIISELKSLLAILGVCRPVFIGHSLGGSVAAQLLIAGTASPVGAIIVDTDPLFSNSSFDVIKSHIVQGYRAYSSISEYGRWLLETRIFVAPSIVEMLARESLVERADRMLWPRFDLKVLDLLDVGEETIWWPKILKCRRPFFLIRGAASGIFTKAIANQIAPDVPYNVITVPAAGHAIMTDNPKEFHHCVTNILNRQLCL